MGVQKTIKHFNNSKFILMYVRKKYLAYQTCDFTNLTVPGDT